MTDRLTDGAAETLHALATAARDLAASIHSEGRHCPAVLLARLLVDAGCWTRQLEDHHDRLYPHLDPAARHRS